MLLVVSGIDKDGFNQIDVTLTERYLVYETHDESKSEGYHFTMERVGDHWVSVKDETSYTVWGTHVLWLYSQGCTDWDEARRKTDRDWETRSIVKW